MLISVISVLLRIVQIALFAGLILTWFPIEEDGKFVHMIRAIAQPASMPFRLILSRLRFLRKIPFDLSYIFTLCFLELIIQIIM